MFQGFGDALGFLGQSEVLALIIGATVLGTVASLIPGLSSAKMLALAIPFTYTMETMTAMGFMSALLAAGGFAGALTSILIGVPGDGLSAATVLDGHPMAKQGRAGEAIGATAAASALGALVGVVIVVAMIPIIRSVALLFGPSEIAVLSLAAISLVAMTAGSHPVKGLISGAVGMLVGLVGLNATVGEIRFTFGIRTLEDGIRLVPVLLGLFAIPTVVELFRYNVKIAQVPTTWEGDGWKGVRAVLRRWRLLIRSSVGGTVIGMLPGVGGSIAVWAAYFDAKRVSKDPDSFGTGNIEGVIAPEASNDAKDAGQLLTFLALGVPTGVGTAVMLGAFQIHGIFPGPRLFEQRMDLIWVIILTLVMSNILTSVWGMMFIRWIVKLTEIPPSIMVCLVTILALMGSYADLKQYTGVLILVVFGVLGTVMQRYGYGAAPFLVGLILLPIVETNYYLSMQINRGSHVWLLRPGVLIIIALVVLVLVGVPILRRGSAKRRAEVIESVSGAAATVARDEVLGSQIEHPSEFEEEVDGGPDTVRALSGVELAMVLAFGVAGVAVCVASFGFRPGAKAVPRIVGILFLALLAWRLWEGWKARRATLGDVETEGSVRSYRYISAWLLALPGLAWALGIVPASLLYVVVFPFAALRDERPLLHKIRDLTLLGSLVYFLLGYVMPQHLGVHFPDGAILAIGG
ncbi:MAG: hypothetical protein GEU79_07635 [Acidimicrobiia bacterium]|nr:hypothetical protein [Acidimicrobiia bacterium]